MRGAPAAGAAEPDARAAQVALYFGFIEALARWMLLTGLVGLVPMLGYGLYGTMDNWIASVYAVVGLVGCFGFTKYWQRKTRELAYRWNTEAADTGEVERYDFRFDAHDEASGEP